MTGDELIELLEEPNDERGRLMLDLRWTAPTATLLDAFATAESSETRGLLADLLGFRGDPEALDPLLAALDEPDDDLRASVADALGKLFLQEELLSGDAARRAGEALLGRFEVESSAPVKTTLAVALGSARYRPAAGALEAALAEDDEPLARNAREALERIARGPRHALSGAQIVAALETPTEDRRPLMRLLLEDASNAALVDALSQAERPLTRQLLADLLGEQTNPGAIDALLPALDDADTGVRASAADALGKILLAGQPRDPAAEKRAGAALLARFETETAPGVRHMLASAVGAAGYEPALPALRAALQSDDPQLVAAAEWGLHWLEDGPEDA